MPYAKPLVIAAGILCLSLSPRLNPLILLIEGHWISLLVEGGLTACVLGLIKQRDSIRRLKTKLEQARMEARIAREHLETFQEKELRRHLHISGVHLTLPSIEEGEEADIEAISSGLGEILESDAFSQLFATTEEEV